MDNGFTYAEQTALDTEAQYPYKAVGKTCSIPADGTVKVTDYTDVTPLSPDAMKQALVLKPVSIAVDASRHW